MMEKIEFVIKQDSKNKNERKVKKTTLKRDASCIAIRYSYDEYRNVFYS